MSTPWSRRIDTRALSRAADFYGLASPYDETNANDDHGRPGRQDYSVLLLAPGSVTLTVTQPAWGGPWVTRASGSASTVLGKAYYYQPGAQFRYLQPDGVGRYVGYQGGPTPDRRMIADRIAAGTTTTAQGDSLYYQPGAQFRYLQPGGGLYVHR